MWPDRRLLDLFGIEHPIIQAPMAGAQGAALAIAVSKAGGLGSLPCALLTIEHARAELQLIRQQTDRPFNLNFFCHRPPAPDAAREAKWVERLAPYRRELGVEQATVPGARAPFGEEACALVEEFRPRVVSFHFGLPEQRLFDRVKAAGARVIASATTVAEARWLEKRGVDAVIAQGAEAGGHRGMFLSEDLPSQPGIIASRRYSVCSTVGRPAMRAGSSRRWPSLSCAVEPIGDGRCWT
jgi:nitronate monooxygenase